MKLTMPHPRRDAQQRRADEQARIRKAVRQARLDTYCPQAEDRLDRYRQQQEWRRR